MTRAVSYLVMVGLIAGCGGSPSPATEAPAPPESKSASRGHGHDQSHGHNHVGPRFADPEQYAQRWNSPERDARQKPDQVMAILDLSAGMTAVDLGTGTGYFVPRLSAAVGGGGKVLALDIEKTMVDYVRKRAADEGWTNVEARVVAADDPGLAAGSVDRVLLVNTWHHIARRPAYAKRLLRALRPGGALVIVDVTMDAKRGPPKHIRVPAANVVKELVDAGFTAEIVGEDLANQYIVRGRKGG